MDNHNEDLKFHIESHMEHTLSSNLLWSTFVKWHVDIIQQRLFLDNKRLDEWVTVERLNLQKVQLPKLDEKKKNGPLSASSSHPSKSKLNPSKVNKQQKPNTESSSQQPAFLDDSTSSGTSPNVRNKNNPSNVPPTARKRKAKDEVIYLW